MGRAPEKPPSGSSLRSRKGRVSLLFAGTVLLALFASGAYVQVSGKGKGLIAAVDLKYREFIEGFINDPDNEAMRADLIARVVEHYRTTPSKKSLPLRDDDGRIIGRFRIEVAKVDQPHKDSPDAAQRRIYTCDLTGFGELWHETGGRVRFTGSAFVTYHVDFKVEDWAAYAYFACASIERARFECEHIDNILGQIFKAAVRKAGTAALTESLQPGFTVIAKANGDTWLAAGQVGPEFRPHVGPYTETDRDFETIWNDTTLLHAGFRDYVGPIELFEGNELRITMEAESLEPAKSLGVDVYIVTEDEFQKYEQHYPHKLAGLQWKPLETRIDMQKLNLNTGDYRGNVYIIMDYTGLGSGKDPDQRAEAGLLKYYVRVKR